MSTQNGMTRPAGALQRSLRQSRHYSAAHPGGSRLSMAAAAAAGTAVGRTLTGLGVMLALGSFVIVPPAGAQEEPPSRPVTGSRIVSEREFAAPVYVLDRAAIDAAGVAILGDLLLQIPMIAGAALNPQVNNGGGNGATHVDLRGLGSRKTLLLLNGRRVIASGTFSRDVNAIPISLIERVEVLMEGASVTYGSGAPGGVVNVITRRDHQGLEAVTSYGRSERNDGERTYHSLTMGNVGPDRGLLIGLNFDRRAPVSAADRAFSVADFGLEFGKRFELGSIATPEGMFSVRRASAEAAGIRCAGAAPSVALRRVDGADGSRFDPSNWRCFDFGPDGDLYNFQPHNVVLTPQERFGAFMLGHIPITPDIQLFSESFFHRTRANSQLAPEPVSGLQSGLIISRNNLYNPFGEDVFNWSMRMEALGPRRVMFDIDRLQTTAGLQGRFGHQFSWETYVTVADSRGVHEVQGLLFTDGLRAALGPSFRDANGVIRCGTPTAPIPGCTPINFLALPNDAEAAAILRSLVPDGRDLEDSSLIIYSAHLTGPVLPLRAGRAAFAVGMERREESLNLRPDFLARTGRRTGNSQQPLEGELEANEFYGELAVPILGGLAGVQRLEAQLGLRHSRYAASGNITNGRIGLQWRPIAGLLIRGSYAEVFQEPVIFQTIRRSVHLL